MHALRGRPVQPATTQPVQTRTAWRRCAERTSGCPRTCASCAMQGRLGQPATTLRDPTRLARRRCAERTSGCPRTRAWRVPLGRPALRETMLRDSTPSAPSPPKPLATPRTSPLRPRRNLRTFRRRFPRRHRLPRWSPTTTTRARGLIARVARRSSPRLRRRRLRFSRRRGDARAADSSREITVVRRCEYRIRNNTTKHRIPSARELRSRPSTSRLTRRRRANPSSLLWSSWRVARRCKVYQAIRIFGARARATFVVLA